MQRVNGRTLLYYFRGTTKTTTNACYSFSSVFSVKNVSDFIVIWLHFLIKIEDFFLYVVSLRFIFLLLFLYFGIGLFCYVLLPHLHIHISKHKISAGNGFFHIFFPSREKLLKFDLILRSWKWIKKKKNGRENEMILIIRLTFGS